eukprot:5154688-Lingulodinium_polyedra.AAC.1
MPSNRESRTTRLSSLGSSLRPYAPSAAASICPRPTLRASGSSRTRPSRTRHAPGATQFSRANTA